LVEAGEHDRGRAAKEGQTVVTSPSYQLSDDQWDQIRDLLPKNGRRGGQWKDHRLMIDGILWALSDGGRWRNLPGRFGPWQSVYDRFRNWTRRGLWDRILRHLHARKMNRGEIDWQLFAVDGTVIRAHQSAAGAAGKKSAGRGAGGPRLGAKPGRLRHEVASAL
jgi:transposase